MISIFSQETPPKGGVATILVDIYEYLLKEKVRIRLHFSKNKNINYKFNSVFFYSNLLGPFNLLIPLFVEIFCSKKIVLLDIKGIYSYGILSIISGFRKKDVITFIHGSELDRFVVNPTFIRKILFYKYFYLRGLKYSSSTYYLSSYLMFKFKRYLNLYNIQLNFLKYSLYYPSFNTNKVLKIKNNKLRFLTVCRLDIKKGFNDMIHFFSELKSNNLMFSWDIIGSGKDHTLILDSIRNSSFASRVRLLGAMPNSQVLDEYSNYDIFICLSKYNEGYGLSWFEAGYKGLFIISSRNGNLSLLNKYFTGIYSNNTNEIISIFLQKTSIIINVPDSDSKSQKHLLIS